MTLVTNALMHVSCLQFVATVCHEMGHNNGVGHGSYRDIEYGDPWTVMGGGESTWPSSQWITATKWLWWWIPDSQVVHVAPPGNPHCIDCVGAGTYTIQAHDAGVLCDDVPAALRLFTSVHGETLWVETRSLYDTIKGHGMVHWVREKPSSSDQVVNGLENTQVCYSFIQPWRVLQLPWPLEQWGMLCMCASSVCCSVLL